jgi:hypothetical protein
MDDGRASSLGGYGRTARWLTDQGLNTAQIADALRTSVTYVRQLEYRDSLRRHSTTVLPPELLRDTGIWTPPSVGLRQFLGIRPVEDDVEITPRASRRLKDIRDELERRASRFWSGVRFESGIGEFTALLPEFGRPSHAGWIRLRARVHELRSETHLHSGRSLPALIDGLRAYHLYRVAFNEAHEEAERRTDLLQIGRMARLLSQVFLLRREADLTEYYLGLHLAAHDRLRLPVRPEYHHQLGILAFQANQPEADRIARDELKRAGTRLAETVDYGRERERHEVRDIGERHLYLMDLNWERSREFLNEQLRHYPEGDIHVGLNVMTAAACGLGVNDSRAETEALDLLDRHQSDARGYLRLQTGFELLRVTPRLPQRVRPAWIRFALYENAFDARDRFPRYSKSGG